MFIAVSIYSMDLEHLHEMPAEDRNCHGTEAASTQRMSLPCKHRSRAVIKSASASGLSLMIPSGVILLKSCQHTLHAGKRVFIRTFLKLVYKLTYTRNSALKLNAHETFTSSKCDFAPL
jgi:hypothetical protein